MLHCGQRTYCFRVLVYSYFRVENVFLRSGKKNFSILCNDVVHLIVFSTGLYLRGLCVYNIKGLVIAYLCLCFAFFFVLIYYCEVEMFLISRGTQSLRNIEPVLSHTDDVFCRSNWVRRCRTLLVIFCTIPFMCVRRHVPQTGDRIGVVPQSISSLCSPALNNHKR